MATTKKSRGAAVRQRKPLHEFSAIFRGVRGSYNAPDRDCLGYGGHTICLEVRVGGHVLIFDAGTGIIGLGRELMEEARARGADALATASIFFSHTHHDHVHGLAFFEPAHSRRGQICVFGLRPVTGEFSEVLSHAVHHSYFPANLDRMSAIKCVRTIDDRDVVVYGEPGTLPTVQLRHGFDKTNHQNQVVVYAQKNTAHPKGGTLFFRIEYLGRSLVFATDTEGYVGGDTRLVRFAKGATLLVHDTQYTYEEYIQQRQGWGHSTIEMATTVAKQAEVKQLAMFHYDPAYSDSVVAGLERQAQGMFPKTIASREGVRIDLLAI